MKLMKKLDTTALLESIKTLSSDGVISSPNLYKAVKENGEGISQNRVYTVYMRPEFAGPKRGSWKVNDLLEFIQKDIDSGFTSAPAKSVKRAKPSSRVKSVPATLPTKVDGDVAPAPAPLAQSIQSILPEDEIEIPTKDASYVRWGHFKTINKIVKSRQFFPVYISGLSGNGKTFMVEQACAIAKREYVRVQIAPETDEDDLLGGFRLVNGNTVFSYGPVVRAMKAGAVLLIDELDRGTNKIMCLQGVLEGKPIMLKKTGELIHPAPGFTVIATANTKGDGSDEGRYVSAQIIDDAFLERFVIAVDQPYPTMAVEKNIILRHMTKFDCLNEAFATELAAWSSIIHKTFDNDGIEEVVSTRRLCHIVKTFSIFEDKLEAVKLCITRFDADVSEVFLDLFQKVATNEISWDHEETSE
jgi:hypothetical protein